MARRRERVSRATRSNHEQNWVGIIQEDATVDDTPVVEVSLLRGADWSQNPGLARATLLRLRGWLSVNTSLVEPTEGTFFAGIYLTDVDAPVLTVGTNDPASSGFFLEDILWTGGTRLPASSASNVSVVPEHHWDLDLKSMRKITSDQELRLAMVVGVANIVVGVSSVTRALVRSG